MKRNHIFTLLMFKLSVFLIIVLNISSCSDEPVVEVPDVIISGDTVTDVTKTSAKVSATFTLKSGVPGETGIVYSTGPNPSLSNLAESTKIKDTTNSLSMSISILGLKVRTKYYVKAYIKYLEEYYYSKTLEFETNYTPNSWELKTSFSGKSREDAVCFMIGDEVYVGLGREASEKSDFWAYNVRTGTMTQKSSFPLGSTVTKQDPRTGSVGFATSSPTGNTIWGYVGNGYVDLGNGKTTNYTTWYAYMPSPTNSWKPIAQQFPGNGIKNAVAFAIDNKGYVCTGDFGSIGLESPTAKFYQFDPTKADTHSSWSELPDFPATARVNAVAFVIGKKAYVGCGRNGTNYYKDLYEFSPTESKWVTKASLPAAAAERESAVGFSIGNYGFIGCGSNGTTLLRDFYKYDPQSDTWIAKADFGGSARKNAIGFAIQANSTYPYAYGYIGMGFDGSLKNDVYEYTPDPQ